MTQELNIAEEFRQVIESFSDSVQTNEQTTNNNMERLS